MTTQFVFACTVHFNFTWQRCFRLAKTFWHEVWSDIRRGVDVSLASHHSDMNSDADGRFGCQRHIPSPRIYGRKEQPYFIADRYGELRRESID